MNIEFSNSSIKALNLIGEAIASKPKKIRKILEKHKIKYPDKKSEKKTISAVLFAIKTKGKLFHKDLARILAEDKIFSSDEDSFNLQSLLGGTNETPAGSGITVGADPVSAIAGAVGSIANVVGNSQKKKILEKQARSQMFSSLLSFKQSQRQQSADQLLLNSQLQSDLRKKQLNAINNQKLMIGAGVVLFIGLVGLLSYKKQNQ